MAVMRRRGRATRSQVIRFTGTKRFVCEAESAVCSQPLARSWDYPIENETPLAVETDEGCFLRAKPCGVIYLPEPGVSFGGIPMIFTPEPRAKSIASMMSPYFTPGTPLMKMIFSGRLS